MLEACPERGAGQSMHLRRRACGLWRSGSAAAGSGAPVAAPRAPGQSKMLLILLIDLYSLVLFAAVVLSWVRVSDENPIARVVHQLTEPVLSRVRKILPSAGGFDFSPLVVLIALRLLKALIFRL